MNLRPDQILRQDLLFLALEIYGDVDEALAAAMRMESFIVSGSALASGSQQLLPPRALALDQPEEPGDKSRKRRWNAEELKHLQDLWAEGLSLQEIAVRLDRTATGIRDRARRMGLSRRGKRSKGPKGGNGSGNGGGSPGHGGESGGRGTGEAAAKSGQQKTRAQRRSRRSSAAQRHSRIETIAQREQARAKVEEHLASHDVKRVPLTFETVVNFMRSRDYSVVRMDQDHYKVDNRQVLTANDLLERANAVRRRLGQPEFPDSVLSQPNGA